MTMVCTGYRDADAPDPFRLLNPEKEMDSISLPISERVFT